MTSPIFLKHAYEGIQQGLHHLDQYLSTQRASRSLTWSRIWDSTSSQTRAVQNFLAEMSIVHPNSYFKDKHIDSIQLSCREYSTYTHDPLNALVNDDLQNCQLSLTDKQGNSMTETVTTLFRDKKQSDPYYFGFLRVLNFLTTGDESIASAKEFNQGNNLQKIAQKLSYEEMSTSVSGGRFKFLYNSTVFQPYNKIFSFFYPAATEDEIQMAATESTTLHTICRSIEGEANAMSCSHILNDRSGRQIESLKVDNYPGSHIVHDQNGNAVESWASALKKWNFFAPPRTAPSVTIQPTSGSTTESQMIIYPNLWSQITSCFPTFRTPKIESWPQLLLVPAGLGIAAGGAYYTYKSYMDESKKSILRRTVALTTGVTAIALGFLTALTPFGIFSN